MKSPALTPHRPAPVAPPRGPADARFARGSSPPISQAAAPPERPTCPLDVSELIRLLDVETPDEDVRSTRRAEPQELRTLGVVEAGEVPSLAWAKTPRLADMDDRLAPTTIVELADPPARPLHHAIAIPVIEDEWPDDADYAAVVVSGLERPAEPAAEPDDDLAEIALTFALGAQAVAPRPPLTGFLLGIGIGLAAVAAAFTALGFLGH